MDCINYEMYKILLMTFVYQSGNGCMWLYTCVMNGLASFKKNNIDRCDVLEDCIYNEKVIIGTGF